MPELLGLAQPDLVLVNDDDLTYCKLRLDADSLPTMRTGGLAAISDTLARTLCWSAAWDMVRDGELAARDYLELATASGPSETDIGVVQSVNRQAVRALKLVRRPGLGRRPGAQSSRMPSSPPPARPRPARTISSPGCMPPLRPPAPTRRPTSWPTCCPAAEVLDGLALDTDLRWLLLQALVARGRAGEDEIAAFAAEDRASAGVKAAAIARALVPTAGGQAGGLGRGHART